MSMHMTCDEAAPVPRTVIVTLICDGCRVRTSQSVPDDFMLSGFMLAGWKARHGKHYGPCCSGKKSAEKGVSPSRRSADPQAVSRF